ncbi:MAG TPA: hypothetical protein VF475_11815 [Sphingobium sp.]
MRAFDNYARSLPERAPAPRQRQAVRDTRRAAAPVSRDWRQSHFVLIG